MQTLKYHQAGVLNLTELPPLSLYIHIPWCIKKCPYCDFNSHENKTNNYQEYINALLLDLEQSLPLIWGRSVQTIFIGGGTPSLLPPEDIQELISGVRARLPLIPACEITMEANPGTFEKDRFAAYKQAGITRLSIGVQTFDDQHLKTIGRIHNAKQAQQAIQEAAKNFETYNIDIMYALPGQTLENLRQDIKTALSFAPPHISIYHLTLEPNTIFAKYPPQNIPDEDTAWEMLDEITQITQKAGLQRYEVSAYAKPNHQCQHNLNYWQFGDYLGIGAGAHGKISFAHKIIRQEKYKNPAGYIQKTKEGSATYKEKTIARKDLAFEYMLNALRLKSGFTTNDFCQKTGLPASIINNQINQAIEKGYLEKQNQKYKPTERGFDFLSDLQEIFL